MALLASSAPAPPNLYAARLFSIPGLPQSVLVQVVQLENRLFLADQTMMKSHQVLGVTCRQGLDGRALLKRQHQLFLKLGLEQLLLHWLPHLT